MLLQRIYGKCRKLFTTVRQNGLRDTVWRISLGFFKINRFLVVERNLLEEREPVKGKVPMEIRLGTLEELRSLRAKDSSLPLEFFVDEFDGVDTFYLAFIDGELAGISWIYFAGDPNRFINLREKEVEFKFSYTLEKYRGKNVLPKMQDVMCRALKEKGYERVVGFIHAGTQFNIKASQKGGLKVIGTLTQVGPFRPKYTGSRKATLFRSSSRQSESC